VGLGLFSGGNTMTHTTQSPISQSREPISWPQHIFVALFFLIVLLISTAWFSSLSNPSTPVLTEPKLELSLSGAVGTNVVLTQEEASEMLSCDDRKIQFALPATSELYGLTWTFAMPQALNGSAVFTLGSTFPLTLSLTSQGDAYRTFVASEGELSFDPKSGRGYFTGFLYDNNGERLFASAVWQCE
jgi:hypothetical protein